MNQFRHGSFPFSDVGVGHTEVGPLTVDPYLGDHSTARDSRGEEVRAVSRRKPSDDDEHATGGVQNRYRRGWEILNG